MTRRILKILFSSNNTFLTLTETDSPVARKRRVSSLSSQGSRFVTLKRLQSDSQSTSSKMNNTASRTTRTRFTVSAGLCSFRNAQKKRANAMRPLAQAFLDRAKRIGVDSVEIEVAGFSPHRDALLNNLTSARTLRVLRLTDRTPIAHNGCRPRKKRRL